jgi:hypothetical protein
MDHCQRLLKGTRSGLGRQYFLSSSFLLSSFLLSFSVFTDGSQAAVRLLEYLRSVLLETAERAAISGEVRFLLDGMTPV